MNRQLALGASRLVAAGTSVLALVAMAGCSAGGAESGEGEDFGPSASHEPAPGEFVSVEQEAAEAAEQNKIICNPLATTYRGSVTLANGLWGDWAECPQLCPTGSFAWGISLERDGPANSGSIAGPGDDTAVDGLRLTCKTPSGVTTGTVTSQLGPFGFAGFGDNPMCPAGSPLRGGRVQFEAAQGSGDDTAVNNINGNCANNTNIYPHPLTNWGTMGAWAICPAGQMVCGLRTRVEWDQGPIDDDTTLNGVRFACCTYP